MPLSKRYPLSQRKTDILSQINLNLASMKILFFCGCLEVGSDGVGDYTRRLAAALIREGHTITIVALNDHFVSEDIVQNQLVDATDVNVLRLTAKKGYQERMVAARQWVEKTDPEWLSLQFVHFAYHKKGLPFGLAAGLKNITEGRKWHIMFHELWVGMVRNASLKFQLWGAVQRMLVMSMLRQLKPKLVQTQTQLYHAQLNKLGIHNSVLPLFGNIPNTTANGALSQGLIFVVFGTIHPGAPVEEFAQAASQYGRQSSENIKILFVGRVGAELQHWQDVFARYKIPVEVAGVLTEERISQILSTASFGISTTSFMIVEKSGAVAAMKEHGLPVLCVAKNDAPLAFNNLPLPAGIIYYDQHFFADLPKNKQRTNFTYGVKEAAISLATAFCSL